MTEQIKKDPNDPDASQINPEFIRLARSNGFIKGPMTMYLMGQVTWPEALESMVMLLTKEFREQQSLLVQTLTKHKALPPKRKALPPKRNGRK